MITFTEFMKSMGEEILGIYPPQYGGIGNYPPLANQTGPDQDDLYESVSSPMGFELEDLGEEDADEEDSEEDSDHEEEEDLDSDEGSEEDSSTEDEEEYDDDDDMEDEEEDSSEDDMEDEEPKQEKRLKKKFAHDHLLNAMRNHEHMFKAMRGM